MQRLLLWSLRFVEDFAEDIIAVRDDYVRLAARTFAARCLTPAPDVPPERFQQQVRTMLAVCG